MGQKPGLQELLKDSEARELWMVVYSSHQEGRKPGAEGVLDLAIVKIDSSGKETPSNQVLRAVLVILRRIMS